MLLFTPNPGGRFALNVGPVSRGRSGLLTAMMLFVH